MIERAEFPVHMNNTLNAFLSAASTMLASSFAD
jgi:hypothetical protein